MKLILASTSPYRRRLLERLSLPFETEPPGTEESPQPGESPEALARRLSQAKAQDVASRFPDSLVIGSDQVATVDGQLLNKPGDHSTATAQLRSSAGKQVTFYTGVALRGITSRLNLHHVEPFRVKFRPLSDEQIEYYLRTEQPYDCAGSFKCEGLGISLFEAMTGDDPTSLEGLPLITLTSMLTTAGYPVLKHSDAG
ncbi:MAG: Maf family nucleotide pyrophosphatase [Halieaceae bacterium]